MIGPNFLVIGAARSGTTALTRFLAQHPQVFVSEPKEPHFLALGGGPLDFRGPGDDHMINRRAVSEARDYLRLFEPGLDSQAVGEGSVSTLYYHPESIPRIRKHAPEAKMIAILRDPVERAYSSFLYMTARGFEPLSSFAESLDAEAERIRQRWHHIWHYTRMGFYVDQLRAFRSAFGEDRLLVLTSDELRSEPAVTLERVFVFLGVDPAFRATTSQEINRSGSPRNQMLAALINRASRNRLLRALARRLTSIETRHALRQSNLERPEMPAECRTRLADLYRPEIERLESLLRRDLSRWKAQ